MHLGIDRTFFLIFIELPSLRMICSYKLWTPTGNPNFRPGLICGIYNVWHSKYKYDLYKVQRPHLCDCVRLLHGQCPTFAPPIVLKHVTHYNSNPVSLRNTFYNTNRGHRSHLYWIENLIFKSNIGVYLVTQPTSFCWKKTKMWKIFHFFSVFCNPNCNVYASKGIIKLRQNFSSGMFMSGFFVQESLKKMIQAKFQCSEWDHPSCLWTQRFHLVHIHTCLPMRWSCHITIL